MNPVKVVFIYFIATFFGGILLLGAISAGVLATHSYTNEPQEFYQIGSEFTFEFAKGDPVSIQILDIEINSDELLIQVQIKNLDDDVYVDSPYQFKVVDENNKVFVPIVQDYKDYEIDEIVTGEILTQKLVYHVDDPELKHTLIINEYFGNEAVGIEYIKLYLRIVMSAE